MITITIPFYLVILIVIAVSLDVIVKILNLYSWVLKKRLDKYEKEND